MNLSIGYGKMSEQDKPTHILGVPITDEQRKDIIVTRSYLNRAMLEVMRRLLEEEIEEILEDE